MTELNQYTMMNNETGEIVPAKLVRLRSSAIFHKTTDGKWIKKIHALRDSSIVLTGETQRQETAPSYTLREI